jgi:hypothetical protein
MIVNVLTKAIMISMFVFVMMLAIDYVNMSTRGAAQRVIRGGRWRQYLLAVALGATPGCLGAFAVVGLYAHGLLSLGALVGCMIATSGDEAFVLLAMSPRFGLLLTAVLFLVGLGAAWLTDRLSPKFIAQRAWACRQLVVHDEDACGPSSWSQIHRSWKQCSLTRAVLAIGLLLFIVAVASGHVGPTSWNWIRVTLLAVSVFALFVVATVPDHFLEEHLWKHVARKHAPRIFIWTFCALLVTQLSASHVGLDQWIQRNPLLLLIVACMLGVIPESGPHLLFVTLFTEGKIPFSVLLASSIVQDGHGMLPMLAESPKMFAVVKGINLIIGLFLGMALLTCGW